MKIKAIWIGYHGYCHAWCPNFVKSQLGKISFGKFALVLALWSSEIFHSLFYNLVM